MELKETGYDVGLELRDHIKGVWRSDDKNTDDAIAGFRRLFKSSGKTSKDALSYLSFARLILSDLKDENNSSYTMTALLFELAVVALEEETGCTAGQFLPDSM